MFMRILLILLFILLIPACSPLTFSSIQNAKVVDEGKIEYTPSLTYLSPLQYNYGLQIAYGLKNDKNLRFRFERIKIGPEDAGDFLNLDLGLNLTHLSFGLKQSISKNKSAFHLPLSFTKSDDSNNILTLFEPTYFYTITGKREYLESSSAFKLLIPIDDLKNSLFCYNLGFGLSNNLSKWALRTEIGILVVSDGTIFQSSVGLSIYP